MWGSDKLDNAGQQSDCMLGESRCVLLGNERVNESVLHSASLFHGKCGALICLIMWGSLVTPYLVIRDVCCLAVNDESFLHSTSLLQRKCGAVIYLIMWGSQVTPCPVNQDVCCLAMNELMSQSCIQPHSFTAVWCSVMLDNAGQPSDSMPGDSGCVLLGSER